MRALARRVAAARRAVGDEHDAHGAPDRHHAKRGPGGRKASARLREGRSEGLPRPQGLDPALVELIQIRASHLNHCTYCLHTHTNDARKAGESEDRLHKVAVWREARHFFTEREQAALALTEAVTLVSEAGVPNEVYAEAAARFDEEEPVHVLALILAINTWNRVALPTGKVAGTDERRG